MQRQVHRKVTHSSLPFGAAATPSTSGSSPTHRNNRSASRMEGSLSMICWLVVFAVMVVIVLVGWQYLIKWQREQELLYEQKLQEQLDPMTREWEERVLKLQEENEKLQQSHLRAHKYDEGQMKLQNHAAVEQKTFENQINELKSQVDRLLAYKTRMHTAIQQHSRQALVEKFGPGPHRVEILLDFHPADPGEGTASRIILELAPIEHMPHAVYWFLSQVHLGVWNGASFHRNANHVLQAGAARNFQTPADVELAQRFRNSGFESVLFQEYSPEYPHLPLTVGYAGRPGGPDFYISLKDNSIVHGPGGQKDYDDPTEADPCFAKVVEGEDAVWRMHKLRRNDDGYQGLVYNVAILGMRILS